MRTSKFGLVCGPCHWNKELRTATRRGYMSNQRSLSITIMPGMRALLAMAMLTRLWLTGADPYLQFAGDCLNTRWPQGLLQVSGPIRS